MTAAEAVQTSVTNSLSQDYTNLDHLSSPICNFILADAKPFYSLTRDVSDGKELKEQEELGQSYRNVTRKLNTINRVSR